MDGLAERGSFWLREEEDAAHATSCHLPDEVLHVLAELEQVEVVYFIVFGLGLKLYLEQVVPVLLEGEPSLQQLRTLRPSLLLIQQF